jgi:hypothetical protein
MADDFELLQYSHTHYDSLPDIVTARKNSEERAAAVKSLSEIVGELFVQHKVMNEFAIILLHNHFPMLPSKRLVQFGNAAVPWDTLSLSSHLQKTSQMSWRFLPGGLAPYEFLYTGSRKTMPPTVEIERHGPFIVQLAGVLADCNLLDIFGLCILDDPDINAPGLVEITSGRANIMLDVDIDSPRDAPDHGLIESVW